MREDQDRLLAPTRGYDSSDDEMEVLHERMADLAGRTAASVLSTAAIAEPKREKAVPSARLPSAPAPRQHPTVPAKPVQLPGTTVIKHSPPVIKRVRSIPRQGRSIRALSKSRKEAPPGPADAASTAEPTGTAAPATKSRYMREKNILKDYTKLSTTTLQTLKPLERHLTSDTRQFLQQMNTIMQSPTAATAAAASSSSAKVRPGQIRPHFLHSTASGARPEFDRKPAPSLLTTLHPPATPRAKPSIPAPPSQGAGERSAESPSALVVVATAKAPPPSRSPMGESGLGGGNVGPPFAAGHDERLADLALDGGGARSDDSDDDTSHSMEVDDPHDNGTDIAEGSFGSERAPSAADTGDSETGSVAAVGVAATWMTLEQL